MGALKIIESTLASDLPDRMQVLADAAQAEDGVAPFSEQTHVEIARATRQTIPQAANVRVFEALGADQQLLGLAILVRQSQLWVLEVAVAPAWRRQGLGRALISLAVQALEGQPFAAWVHGGRREDTPALQAALALSSHLGWKISRELYKLELPLTDRSREKILMEANQTTLPQGLELITYTPDQAQPWVELNAQAFANHPEQGRLTLEDLQIRTESRWFRPEGFFLAQPTRPGDYSAHTDSVPLAGYHWTKIPQGQELKPEGEVYAVGVAPSWQGKGLGKVLTLKGMAYLAAATDEQGRSLERIVLYVDADNPAALSLYRSLGFTPLTVDRQYQPATPVDRTVPPTPTS